MLPGKVMLTLFVLWTSASFGKGLSPNCSYITDSKEWFLTGICTVIVQNNVGWCRMKGIFKTFSQTVNGNFTSVKISNSDYFWNCSARIELPSSNGSYLFEVEFAEIVPIWRPAFTVTIAEPEDPILKNCPQHVTEGESVTCECSSERDGEPRPVFSWRGQTDSSVLRLYDVTVNETYLCQMYWGKQTRTVTYSLVVIPDENGSDASSAQIIGVVVAAVFFIIIVITIVVIFIIRRKRDIWTRIPSTKSRLSEAVLTENSFYGDFEVDSGREFNAEDNVNEDYSMQSGKSQQPDVYANVENDGKRQTMPSDLYANVEMNEGRQTTQEELYAAVEKNKERQPGQPDLYAAVVKSKGKQKAKADKFRSPGAKQDFTNKEDPNAAVDKGAKPEIQGEETYAQVIKPAK